MAAPIEASQTEFSHLSKLQVEKHTTGEVGEHIESIFAGAVNKRTWYSTFPYKLESNFQDDKITYKVLHTPEYLAHVYITQGLPALRVKEKWKDDIQICWPHNFGNNITPKGEFCIGSTNIIQTIDSKWLDDYQQLMIENGHEHFINKCQGNLPFLENWSTFLPEYTLTPIQPYFIDADTEAAFPIYRIDPQVEISFKYKIRRNFRDTLRMRKRCGNTWKEIAFNKTYVEGNFVSDDLPLPSMWGIFYTISKAEIDTYLEPDDNGVSVNMYEQMINEVIAIDKDDKYSYGTTAHIDLHSAHPCRFVTIKAENCMHEKTRNYSNYTTDVNVYNGWSPIKSFSSLDYGPTKKMHQIDSYHTDRMFPYYHAPRVPYEPGYNLIPFSAKISDFNFDVGVILSNLKVKLPVEIGNTNPMITTVKIYKEGDEPEDIFLSDDDDNGKERQERDDVYIEDEKEEEKSASTNNIKYKLIVRVIVNKTLVYSREEGKKYFDVHFRKHEDSVK